MENLNIAVQWPGWKVTGELGAGASGVVYEIERDIRDYKEKAALKVISIPKNKSDIDEMIADGYDRKSLTKRFEDYLEDIIHEYSVMAEMKGCTNIVYCDDIKLIQHDDGIGWDIYIKMELLTPLPKAVDITAAEDQVIKIGRDICNAVAFCEKRNIIHRDIKPQNIFMTQDGTYKLGDFGIAKTMEHTTSGTKTGTFRYMAPEVYNNQPYGAKADIYSLGLVLHWLLNERRAPFLPLPPVIPTASEEIKARENRMSGMTIPEPAHGSGELKRIVLKACAYDVEDRYRSAQEMLDDLEMLSATYKANSLHDTDITENVFGFESGENGAPEKKTDFSGKKEGGRDAVGSALRRIAEWRPKKKLALILIPIAAAVGISALALSGRPWANGNAGASARVDNMTMADSAIEIAVDDTYRLTALFSPTDKVDVGVNWQSADPSVATVSEDGVVTAVKVGKTTIVATADTGGLSCTCEVIVKTPTKELALNAVKLELAPEETYQLAVKTDGAEEIHWSSSDPEIAQVSGNGLVTAVGLGDVVITASTADGQVSAVCRVKVYRKVTGVEFVQASRKLRIKKYYTLAVKITPADATNKNLIWSSSNTGIAVITDDGRILTVGYGRATITVTTEDGGFSAECTIVVVRHQIEEDTDPSEYEDYE